jgi:hypothetical protein
MPAAGIVLVIFVVVAVAVIAGYLIVIALALKQVSTSLQTVIGFVGQIPERTAPIEPVVDAINKDLGTARGVLEGLLLRKLGPGTSPTRMRYERAASARVRPPAATTQSVPINGPSPVPNGEADTETFFGPADVMSRTHEPPVRADPPLDHGPADPFLQAPDDLFGDPAPKDGPPRLRPRRRGE